MERDLVCFALLGVVDDDSGMGVEAVVAAASSLGGACCSSISGVGLDSSFSASAAGDSSSIMEVDITRSGVVLSSSALSSANTSVASRTDFSASSLVASYRLSNSVKIFFPRMAVVSLISCSVLIRDESGVAGGNGAGSFSFSCGRPDDLVSAASSTMAGS